MHPFNLDECSIFFRGGHFLFDHLDWNGILRTHRIYVGTRQRNNRPASSAHRCDLELVRDPKRCGLASTKSTTPWPSLFAVDVFAVHNKEILQAGPIHAAPIIRNSDALPLAVEEHPYYRLCAGVCVLKTV